MGLQISFDAGTLDPRELQALAALIGALSGPGHRVTVDPIMPEIRGSVTLNSMGSAVGAASETKVQPGPQHRDVALAPDGTPHTPASEALLAQEAARAAVPTPPPPAPTAGGENTTSAASAPSPSSTLDAAGLPWDERIHAGSKERNKDDTWRARRNTPADVIQTVTAELRRQYPDPTAAQEAPGFPPPPPPAATASAEVAATTAAEVPAPPPPPPAATGGMTVPQFISAVNKSSDPAPTYDALNTLAKTMFGVETFREICTSRHDLFADFLAMVGGE